MRAAAERLARAIARDEVGDVGVGDRDEVAARRIERIEEQAGLAGERPAIGREHLLAAVREVAQETEVLQQVPLALDFLRELRLVDAEPFERPLERVHGLERMELRVADDADRVRAGGKRDEPRPVALAAQVVGRQPAQRRLAAPEPGGVRRPLVDVDLGGEAEPDGVRVVRVVLLQPELALDEAGATRGVDEPAAPDFPARMLFHETHPVSRAVRAEIEAAHDRAIDELDAERTRVLAEEVLEDAAIELVARRRQVATRAELRDLIDCGCCLR